MMLRWQRFSCRIIYLLVGFLGLQCVVKARVEDCLTDITQLLDPSYADALAVAHDASSSMNMDAFNVLSTTVGYPGPIGDYVECRKVHLFAPAPAAIAPAQTHLCLAGSIALNTSIGIPPFGGVCVPESCEPEDLSNVTLHTWLQDTVYRLEDSGTFTATQIDYLQGMIDMGQVCQKQWTGYTCGSYAREKFGHDATIVTGCIVLLCLFVVGATVKDLILAPDYPQDNTPLEGATAAEITRSISRSNSRSSNYNKNIKGIKGGASFVFSALRAPTPIAQHVSKGLAAFSIPRNLTRIFHTADQKELSVFEGLKVISMLWIILGHCLAVQASIGYVNPEAAYPPNGMISKPEGQLFFSARFAVDTFFFLSGFLVVYVMIKRFGSKASGQISKWREWLPFFYFHRILRILPPYAFCLLFWWKVAAFMGNGPFWYRWQYFIGLCDQFWWSNMLFINNFVPWHQGETAECFYHTWYLANDMQFYIISPFFVILYLQNRSLGTWVTGICIVASLAAMIIGTIHRHWSALTLDGEWTIMYSEETYTMPWFRVVPYLLGMSLAMYWHERRSQMPRLHFSRFQRFLSQGVGMSLLIFITLCASSGYAAYPCSPSQNPAVNYCGSQWKIGLLVIYNTCTRPLWCLGLTFICLPCFNNQGGLIQQMLSHRGWAPLSRLTFGAYLLHPVIINLWFLNSTTKFHFSRLDFVMTYVCVVTVTFMTSLTLSLLVESPLTSLGRHLEEALKLKHATLKVQNTAKLWLNSTANGMNGQPQDIPDLLVRENTDQTDVFEAEAEAGFEAAEQSPGFLTRHHTISDANLESLQGEKMALLWGPGPSLYSDANHYRTSTDSQDIGN